MEPTRTTTSHAYNTFAPLIYGVSGQSQAIGTP